MNMDGEPPELEQPSTTQNLAVVDKKQRTLARHGVPEAPIKSKETGKLCEHCQTVRAAKEPHPDGKQLCRRCRDTKQFICTGCRRPITWVAGLKKEQPYGECCFQEQDKVILQTVASPTSLLTRKQRSALTSKLES